jgi:hypothetical protein
LFIFTLPSMGNNVHEPVAAGWRGLGQVGQDDAALDLARQAELREAHLALIVVVDGDGDIVRSDEYGWKGPALGTVDRSLLGTTDHGTQRGDDEDGQNCDRPECLP